MTVETSIFGTMVINNNHVYYPIEYPILITILVINDNYPTTEIVDDNDGDKWLLSYIISHIISHLPSSRLT